MMREHGLGWSLGRIVKSLNITKKPSCCLHAWQGSNAEICNWVYVHIVHPFMPFEDPVTAWPVNQNSTLNRYTDTKFFVQIPSDILYNIILLILSMLLGLCV